MYSYIESLLSVLAIALIALFMSYIIAGVMEKTNFEQSEKRCISGFVWDSEKGYTGETCQVGFKG